MTEPDTDLEAKLLAILSEPEQSAQVVDAIEKTHEGNEEELDDEQRAMLQSLLDAGLPTPDEIIRDAACAEHNAEVQAKRQADLAARRERRAKRGKLKGKSKRRRR